MRPSGATRNDDSERRGRRVFLWHRRLGFAAALFVLLLAATGVLLIHGDRLHLADRHVRADWLLDWYGLNAETEPVGFRVGEDWVIWLEDRVYLNDRAIAEEVGGLKGAVRLGGTLAVGSADALLLFTPQGELLERLAGPSLPGAIEGLGVGGDGRLVLRTPEGYFRNDDGYLQWVRSETGTGWAQAAAVPEGIREGILRLYRGEGLTWERVLLDLHSGRLLGAWGPYLMDAAALFLVLLAATGIYNWMRNGR